MGRLRLLRLLGGVVDFCGMSRVVDPDGAVPRLRTQPAPARALLWLRRGAPKIDMGAQTLAMARGYPPGLNIKIDNSIVEFLVAKVTARTHAKWPAGMRRCDLTQRCRLSLPSIPSPSTGGRGCMAHFAKRPRPARERDGRTALQLSTLGVHPFSGVPVLAACMLVCGRADFSAVGGA